MRFLVLGVGDSFTQRGFPACALIEGPEGHVLLECPDLIHRALYEASARAGWRVDLTHIRDVLLTHLHGDHCNGLEAFLFARRVARARDPSVPLPRVFINREAGERLWERLAPAMEGQDWFDRPARAEDYYELRPLDCGVETRVAGLRVECRRTLHTIPTTGFLLSDGRWSLGWSGDTSWDPEHLRWLEQADLIVHEAGSGPIHTPLERLAELPPALRARLRLIHFADHVDLSECGIRPLAEGDVIEAPAPRA